MLESLLLHTKSVTLAWIKAHANLEGNEAADEAAKECANAVNIEKYIPKPWSATKSIVKALVEQEWNTRWISDTQYKHAKKFYPKIDRYKAWHTLKMSRAYLQILVRAITGHNFLAKHQNTIGNPVAPECRLCEEAPETFTHLIITCPVLRHKQDEIFMGQEPTGRNKWKLRNIMQFIFETSVYKMLPVKDHYNEQMVINIHHNYSSSEDSG